MANDRRSTGPPANSPGNAQADLARPRPLISDAAVLRVAADVGAETDRQAGDGGSRSIVAPPTALQDLSKAHLTFNQEVEGSNPSALARLSYVRPGHMGDGPYLRHG